MNEALPCWSCVDEAAGKQRCERWCGLPGKCLSTVAPPTGGFCEFRFASSGNGSTQYVFDRMAFEAALEKLGIHHLTSWDGIVSIDRRDLPKLQQGFERMLRAIAPYVDWSLAADTFNDQPKEPK